jgi:hypothetical protein
MAPLAFFSRLLVVDDQHLGFQNGVVDRYPDEWTRCRRPSACFVQELASPCEQWGMGILSVQRTWEP